jgi:outer membrane protein assembly factor BamB/ankyrin repeat protein
MQLRRHERHEDSGFEKQALRVLRAFVVALLPFTSANAQSADVLWSAAQRGSVADVRAALARGVPVDAARADGTTALFYAAERGHVEVVELLASRRANVNVTAPVRVAGESFRVSALGAAALGWHVEVARFLLKNGAPPPQFLQLNHNLVPYSPSEHERQRDWEVISTILRTPELQPVTRAIVEREVQGTYQTHDGRRYEASRAGDDVRLAGSDGSLLLFEPVGGKTFMQRMPAGQPAADGARRRSDADITMIGRFLQPLPADRRAALTQQFVERGGVWLDFTIGEGRVLGFELRDGGPGRLGGTPTTFQKAGVRPAASPLFEREAALTATARPPINWPSFRGAGATGVADGQSPPTRWDVEKGANVRWKTPIPGFGNSSPIIWGDRIYISTAISSNPNAEFRPGGLRGDNLATDRSEHRWQLLALDRVTGKIVWERTAHVGVPRSGRHLKSTFATATPATDGTYVVVSFGPEGLFCYDVDGNLIWRKDLGIVGHSSYGFASSPIIYRGMVIVQNDTTGERNPSRSVSFIAAYNLTDGAERWRTPRDEDHRSSFGTPTVYEGVNRPAQIVTNGGERARAYDPMTGKEIWSLAAPSDIVTPSPVVGADLIYIMSGNTGYQPIYAVRSNASGDITLKPGEDSSDFVAWSSTRGGSFTPTPILYGDYLYSVNVSGIVGCYDARTGERKYLARLEHLGAGLSSSPVAADGRLYFSSEDGEVFVVKAGPTFELLATNPMGEVIMATPAVSGGTIFIRTLRHLWAIGGRS